MKLKLIAIAFILSIIVTTPLMADMNGQASTSHQAATTHAMNSVTSNTQSMNLLEPVTTLSFIVLGLVGIIGLSRENKKYTR